MLELTDCDINLVHGAGLGGWISVAEYMVSGLVWANSSYSSYVGAGRRIEHTLVW